jgi:hypothetical protein
MSILSTVLELVGLAAVAVGLGLLAPWLGVTVAGLGLIGLGVLLDPPRRAP